MATKSVLNDSKQVERAVALIQLGARLQVLESETDLSYERLLRLYKEEAGRSPSKGQLPFSTEWFLTWLPVGLALALVARAASVKMPAYSQIVSRT